MARWVRFPWDQLVDTTFAIGVGPSFATRKAWFERDEESGRGGSRLLTALIFELTLAAPRHPDWAVALRLHHRS
jgi:hypothetical protein